MPELQPKLFSTNLKDKKFLPITPHFQFWSDIYHAYGWISFKSFCNAFFFFQIEIQMKV